MKIKKIGAVYHKYSKKILVTFKKISKSSNNNGNSGSNVNRTNSLHI